MATKFTTTIILKSDSPEALELEQNNLDKMLEVLNLKCSLDDSSVDVDIDVKETIFEAEIVQDG